MINYVSIADLYVPLYVLIIIIITLNIVYTLPRQSCVPI